MQVTIDDHAALQDLPNEIKRKVVAACFLSAGGAIALMTIIIHFM